MRQVQWCILAISSCLSFHVLLLCNRNKIKNTQNLCIKSPECVNQWEVFNKTSTQVVCNWGNGF